ncbi:hypothetical protein FVE85_3297 [Porphyridium purpureum]|uniref:Uncharacterized protein n=1 Tax=Porphyridium purpureum TaxID=35688 RepID=A0A5J4YUM9_PORPP|nr:hypothetical protein FVE85_3297 [Porphyridium purpureum]|eukprot:POR0142..scf227_4
MIMEAGTDGRVARLEKELECVRLELDRERRARDKQEQALRRVWRAMASLAAQQQQQLGVGLGEELAASVKSLASDGDTTSAERSAQRSGAGSG